MSTAVIAMAKNEADIAQWWAKHYWSELVDEILVLDNNSTDGTGDILRDEGVTVIPDPDPAYYQSAKMSALAARAGTDWIIPADLDELWYSPTREPIADVLRASAADVITCPVYSHVPAEITDVNPFVGIPWRRCETEKMSVVAFRYEPGVTIAQGNHDVRRSGVRAGGLEVRHFQYRSREQMERKFRQGKAAYEATSLPPSEGEHWRSGGAMTAEQLDDAWAALVAEAGLVFDPAPYCASYAF